MKITYAELIDALADATSGDGPEDARTLAELMAEHQIARDRMLEALRLCRTQGRLVVHRVYRDTLLGHRQRVPAYTITPVAKSSKKPARRTARR